MARILIILGVLLLVSGVVAPVAGIHSMKIPGLGEPSADTLCRPGETLKKSATAAAAQIPAGVHLAQYFRYHCIDTRGTSRDVTDEYVRGIGGQASGFITQLLGSVALSAALPMLGTFLLIAGIVASIRRGIVSGQVRVVTPVYADLSAQARSHESPSDPATRLRQLESMLQSKLISSHEYETKRKEILNQL